MYLSPINYQSKVIANNNISFTAKPSKLIISALGRNGVSIEEAAIPAASLLAVMMGINSRKVLIKQEDTDDLGSTCTAYTDLSGNNVKWLNISPCTHAIHMEDKYEKGKQVSASISLSEPGKSVNVVGKVHYKNYDYECVISNSYDKGCYSLLVYNPRKNYNGQFPVLGCALNKDFIVIGGHDNMEHGKKPITLDIDKPLPDELIKKYRLKKPLEVFKESLALLNMPEDEAIKTAKLQFDAKAQN